MDSRIPGLAPYLAWLAAGGGTEGEQQVIYWDRVYHHDPSIAAAWHSRDRSRRSWYQDQLQRFLVSGSLPLYQQQAQLRAAATLPESLLYAVDQVVLRGGADLGEPPSSPTEGLLGRVVRGLVKAGDRVLLPYDHALALAWTTPNAPPWTACQRRILWLLTGYYPQALDRVGLSPLDFEPPPVSTPILTIPSLRWQEGEIRAYLPLQGHQGSELKRVLPGRALFRRVPNTEGCWAWSPLLTPPEATRLWAWVGAQGLDVEVEAWSRIRDGLPHSEHLHRASYAADAPPVDTLLGGTLRPFQRAGVDYALITERCFIADDMGLGKALPLDTPIRTPSGWAPMGSLRTGDLLCATDGTVASISAVYPQGLLPLLTLTISDGTTIRCSPDHLWSLDWVRPSQPRQSCVLSAAHLSTVLGANGRWEFPIIAAVLGVTPPDVVDPCTLGGGLALGDSPPPWLETAASAYRRIVAETWLTAWGRREGPLWLGDTPLPTALAAVLYSLGGGLFSSRNAVIAWIIGGAGPSRWVVGIEPAEPASAQCLTVSTADHLYLTTGYLPTHNTVQGLAALEKAAAYPAVVVCPAVMRLPWARECAQWVPHRTVQVVDSKHGPGDAEIIIISYAMLSRWVSDLQDRRPKAVIADESHYLQNPTARRTKAMLELVSGRVADNIPPLRYRWALSGTPIKNSPKNLIAQLSVLGRLEEFGGSWAFLERYCALHQDEWGRWHSDGATNLVELNERLRSSCYVRRRKSEVLPELPVKQRSTVPIDLSNQRDYDAAQKDLIAFLRRQAAEDQAFLTSLASLTPAEQRTRCIQLGNLVERKARRALALTRLTTLKHLVDVGKRNGVRDWVSNFLSTGEKLIVAAEHTATQQFLVEAFPDGNAGRGIVHLLARDSDRARTAAVDRFQQDPQCALIICSLVAAGVGITLTAASNVAIIGTGWTPSDLDQMEDRVNRIGQHESSINIYYLVASHTIEDYILAVIDRKYRVTQAATNGPLLTEGSLREEVLAWLAGLPDRPEAEIGRFFARRAILQPQDFPQLRPLHS